MNVTFGDIRFKGGEITMTNKLLEKVTRINANNEKYGDVSFTASDVIEIARNLSVAVIMSIDEKIENKYQQLLPIQQF